MSITHLPFETIASIFSFICDKTSLPSGWSQTTFAKLCLVSKQFLPHAQSSLYHYPIPIGTVTWSRALSVVNSLDSTNGDLARSLDGIIEFVSKLGQLAEPPNPLSFQLRGYTKTFSLYQALLSACPHLTSVEIIVNSSKHLTKLFKALERSSSSLRTIKFANSSSSPTYHITDELVHKALNHANLRNIENVIIQAVDGGSQVDSTDTPRTPQDLTSCNMFLTSRSLAKCQPFLPQNSSNLRKLVLSVGYVATKDAARLLDYLPATLDELSLAQLLPGQPTISNYQAQSSSSLPHDLFSRFSNLRKLSLHGFTFTPKLLEVLASNSPKLYHLALFGSKWIPIDSSQTTRLASRIIGILDATLAHSYLSSFKHLETVDLGYLPTLDRETYRGLELAMDRRGIDFEWEECIDGRYCPFCGEIHR